jgi:protein required for attachment to host cells
MQNECGVIVADAARARFLTLQPAEQPEIESTPNLVERKDLVNPEADERGRDLWSETKTGLGRSPAGQQAHSYDDHREDHEAEFERRFARKIAEEAKAFMHTIQTKRLIVAAPKKFLGLLRPALTECLKQDVSIDELGKDLVKLNRVELHERLAEEALLPRRQPPRRQPRDRIIPPRP